MIGKILGVGETQFKSDAGETIHGYNVYYGVQERATVGLACERKFFRDNDEDFLVIKKTVGGDVNQLINKNVDIVFNRKGRVETLKLA